MRIAFTNGFAYQVAGAAVPTYEPFFSAQTGGSATPTIDTATLGRAMLKYNRGAGVDTGGAYLRHTLDSSPTEDGWYYLRYRIYFPSLPASDVVLFQFQSTTTLRRRLVLKSTGSVEWDSGEVVGTLSAGVQHVIEAAYKQDSTPSPDQTAYKARIDAGTEVAGTTVAVNSGFPNRVEFMGGGAGSTPVIPESWTVLMNDFAENDDSGSANNSWPGDAKQIVLRPVSDVAIGTEWVHGDLSVPSADAYQAMDDMPPTLAEATPEKYDQLVGKNPGVTTTPQSNVDVEVQSPSEGGAPASATVLASQVVMAASRSGIAAVLLALQALSNPSEGAELGSIAPGLNAAAWPTSWNVKNGNVIESSVTVGTRPQVRAGRRDTVANQAFIASLGLAIEFSVPPVSATASAKPQVTASGQKDVSGSASMSAHPTVTAAGFGPAESHSGSATVTQAARVTASGTSSRSGSASATAAARCAASGGSETPAAFTRRSSMML